jgi:anti-sigma factor (TIGR02949 family)
MFTCKDSIDLLLDFLDGDMADEDARRLEEHLSACPPCVDFVKTYRATSGLCKKALKRAMPDEMSAKLTEFLRTNCKK